MISNAKQFTVKVANHFAAAEVVGRAGGILDRAVGHRLRQGPRVRRDRAPRQNAPELLDRCRPHAGGHQTDGHRGHARRVHAARHLVRENRAYLNERIVDVPWTNKKLTVKWEHFISKLGPAQKETWTAVVTGPDAKKAVAEMVAALYDASLDAYLPHRLAGVVRRLPARDFPGAITVREPDAAAAADSVRVAFRVEGREAHLPRVSQRDHLQSLGLQVFRAPRATGGRGMPLGHARSEGSGSFCRRAPRHGRRHGCRPVTSADDKRPWRRRQSQ